MAITFFGVATTPADGSANATDPCVITPPGSMTLGDLVLMIGQYRSSSGTLARGEPSNQDWTPLTQHNTTNCRRLICWCTFNGTWGGSNPSIDMPGTSAATSAQMLVFRPTSTSYRWKVDVAMTNTTYTAPTTPFTVTVTGGTIASNSVAIAMWHSVDDNTWGTLSGAGWSKTSLAAQYRNTQSSSNHSATYAYYIGSGATGNVSQNQATLGGDAGARTFMSFTEYIPLSPGFNTNTRYVFPRNWR